MENGNECSQGALAVDQYSDRFYDDTRPQSVNPYRHLNGSSMLSESYSNNYYDYHAHHHSGLGPSTSHHGHLAQPHHHPHHHGHYSDQSPTSFSHSFHHSTAHHLNYPAGYNVESNNIYSSGGHCTPAGDHSYPPPSHPPAHPHPHHHQYYYERVPQPELTGYQHDGHYRHSGAASDYSKGYESWETPAHPPVHSHANGHICNIGSGPSDASSSIVGCPPTPHPSSLHGSSSVRSPSQSNSSWSPRTTPSPISPHAYNHTRRSPGHAIGQIIPNVNPAAQLGQGSPFVSGRVTGSTASSENASPLQSLHKMLDDSRDNGKVYDHSIASKIFNEHEPEIVAEHDVERKHQENIQTKDIDTEAAPLLVPPIGGVEDPASTPVDSDKNEIVVKKQASEEVADPETVDESQVQPEPILNIKVEGDSISKSPPASEQEQSINSGTNFSDSNQTVDMKSIDDNSTPIGGDSLNEETGTQANCETAEGDDTRPGCPLVKINSPAKKSRKRKKSEGESLLASNRSMNSTSSEMEQNNCSSSLAVENPPTVKQENAPRRKGRPKGSKNRPKDSSRLNVVEPAKKKRKPKGNADFDRSIDIETKPADLKVFPLIEESSQSPSIPESNKNRKKIIGPFVRVEKRKARGVDATPRYRVVNAPLKELEGSSKLVFKPARCFMDLKLKPPTNSPAKKRHMMRANSETLARDESWLCTLCHRPSHSSGLGVLFGPYQMSQESNGESPNNGTPLKVSPPLKMNKKHKGKGKEPARVRSLRGKRGSQDSIDESSSSPEIWLHEDCVVWSEGVCVLGNEICGLEQIIRDSKHIICVKCEENGASLGCVHRKCPNRYHFWCAKESGCDMDEERMTIKCAAHKLTPPQQTH